MTAPAARGRARAVAPVTQVAPRNRGEPGPAERDHLAATLGATLRRERARVGISQHRLAVLAGCHRRTIERLEAGRLRPTRALVDALAHALTVPPGFGPGQLAADVQALAATLAAAAGASLVESTPGGQRRRRRRLRKARLAANATALPVLREMVARRSMPGHILTTAESDALCRAAWRCKPP